MIEERGSVAAAWASVAIQAFSTHCLLWEHSPSYQRAVRRLWRRLPRPAVRTVLRGRLAHELDQLLTRCGL